jgi:hypothetical protein
MTIAHEHRHPVPDGPSLLPSQLRQPSNRALLQLPPHSCSASSFSDEMATFSEQIAVVSSRAHDRLSLVA